MLHLYLIHLNSIFLEKQHKMKRHFSTFAVLCLMVFIELFLKTKINHETMWKVHILSAKVISYRVSLNKWVMTLKGFGPDHIVFSRCKEYYSICSCMPQFFNREQRLYGWYFSFRPFLNQSQSQEWFITNHS